jgi:hypothetical protein
MTGSPEEAHLLFRKWLEESLPLRVKLISSTLIFEAFGTVASASSSALQLRGASWQFTVPLGGVNAIFSDPREIGEASVRALEGARYEYGLALELPNGDRLALLEIKVPETEEPA